jgi:hypothetical protein
MRVQIQLTGTTPLMMHNERLSDQSDRFTILIKELTAKGKNKTTADDDDISKLEWYGGTYSNDKAEVVMRSANLIRCLRDAAAITKQGKGIARALSPLTMSVPLIVVNGPRLLDELWGDGHTQWVDRRMVKPQRGRVKRTRPIFPKWKLIADFELLDTVMNFTTLQNICEIAGLSTGLGDARILGYGRFECKIVKLKAA